MIALKKIVGTIVTLAVVACIALVGYGWYFSTHSSVKTQAQNAAIDTLGIKGKISAALQDNKSQIAAQLGVSDEQVDAAIQDLDIESWEATDIPSTVTATDTMDYEYEGQSVQLTTYDDPSYVTVDAYGTSVDLAVPESAQSYITMLQ